MEYWLIPNSHLWTIIHLKPFLLLVTEGLGESEWVRRRLENFVGHPPPPQCISNSKYPLCQPLPNLLWQLGCHLLHDPKKTMETFYLNFMRKNWAGCISMHFLRRGWKQSDLLRLPETPQSKHWFNPLFEIRYFKLCGRAADQIKSLILLTWVPSLNSQLDYF